MSQTVKQIRDFSRKNKINLHGATRKQLMLDIIAEWMTPEFKSKHTRNPPKAKKVSKIQKITKTTIE